MLSAAFVISTLKEQSTIGVVRTGTSRKYMEAKDYIW